MRYSISTWVTEGRLVDERFGEGSGDSIFKFRLFEDADYSAQTSYLCYLASWKSGENEDMRENLALIALMDSGTPIYRFSVSVDQFEDVRDQLYRVLDGLTIAEIPDD